MPGGFRSVPLSLRPAADPSISWSLPDKGRLRVLGRPVRDPLLPRSRSIRLGVRTLPPRERDLHGVRPPAPIIVLGRESCQSYWSQWSGTGAPTGASCRGPGCAEGARCSQADNPCRIPEAALSVHLRHAACRRRRSLHEWERCARCTWRRASGAHCGSPHWRVPPARHCRAVGGPHEVTFIGVRLRPTLSTGLSAGTWFCAPRSAVSCWRGRSVPSCFE